jgi:hypothetical protein
MSETLVEDKLRLLSVERVLNKYALDLAEKAFELLRIAGPVQVRVSLFNGAGLTAQEIDPWISGNEGSVALTGDIEFDEESSTEELRFTRQAVIRRLQDRLASAFGLWREPR